jgi:hypothetical protein
VVSEVKVYFEGCRTGANSRLAKIEARKAFGSLATKLGLSSQPRFIPCGSRQNAFEDFSLALAQAKENVLPLLLVDSEAPVTRLSYWEHLKRRPGDGWEKPVPAEEKHVYLMVECMENWLIADVKALENFYQNDGFLPKNIPARKDVESIDKASVYRALETATARCKRKGQYHKGRHSWKLLALIDPQTVSKKATHAKRFFEALKDFCS